MSIYKSMKIFVTCYSIVIYISQGGYGMKKFLAVITMICLVTTMLAGCNQAQQDGTSDESSKDQKTESQTVTFWSWVPIDTHWETLEPAFAKKYPDVKIDYWRGELPDYQKKLQVAMAANEGPDVLGMQVGGMLKQYAGFLEPIKPLADKAWGQGWEDKLIPAAIQQTTGPSGEIVALPINFTAQQFILYNKSLFKEAGIDNIPKTYDEWKEICDKLSAKGIIPVAFGAKDIWHDADMFVAISNQFAPGKVYEAEAGKVAWTDQVFVDTMKAWKKLFDENIFQEGALGVATYPDARDQYFYSRKAAMFPTGTWHVGYALPGGEKFGTKIENDETGCFILPQIGPYESRAVASVDTAIAINKNSSNKDAAWKLFSFMAMDEGQQIMADFIQGSPAKKGIKITTLDQFKFQAEKDAVEYVNEKIANAVGKRLLNYPELTNALGIAMQDVAAGKPIEQALKEVQEVSDKIKR